MSRLSRVIRSVCMPLDDSWAHSLLPLQQKGFPVAVCWSAKSGCTTVLKWFLRQTGRLDEALAYSDWVHNYREHRLFTAPTYRWQCERLFKHGRPGTSIIKAIRDPASRAVSSFLHFLRRGGDVKHWAHAARVAQWKAIAKLDRQPGISFRQFLLFVNAQQLIRVETDPHFRPQYDALQDRRVDTFLQLEDLATGLEAVELRHGLPHIDLHGLSQSAHHKPPSAAHGWPANAATFVADHQTLDELGTPPTDAFLDAETLALIRTAYWVDYEAYGHLYDAAPATLRMPTAPAEDARQRKHRAA
ncbi:MAG: hypothetical protein ACKOHK_11890 [Planctomycetia bacterium]